MPTPPPPQPDFPELDPAACQRALAILVDVGTALALECKIPTPDASLPARTLAYDRVALAVRRAILLCEHIAAAPAREIEAATQDAKRNQVRRQIIRTVEDTIQRQAPRADAPALRLELLDRIDTPEFAEDLATRPPEQLIAELCRDLALGNLIGRRPDLRRTPDDIALLCAQAAAATGSGLPRWSAAALPQAIANDTAKDAPNPTLRPDRDETTLCDYLLNKPPRPHDRR